MTRPTFTEEELLWEKGLAHVAGVDEVGRGCFAGPVVAAAVILPGPFEGYEEINDSKLLTAKKREKLAKLIKEHAISYSISEIGLSVINKKGIGVASQFAFREAVRGLSVKPGFILIDAFYIRYFPRKIQKPIIHGDTISMSIAAASILAKVYRDERMRALHKEFESYDFLTNKGYGTKKHREAIRKFGLCPLHRRSFDLNKFLGIPMSEHARGLGKA